MIKEGTRPQYLVASNVAISGLILLLILVLVLRVSDFFDPNQFNEEFRILYHFDQNKTNSVDYSCQFLANAPQPLLYRWATAGALAAGLDLEFFHRLLGAGCFFFFTVGTLFSAARLGLIFALAVTVFAT